jgi:DNA polymerase-4
MDRTILHCDLNGFFASVELLERPDLRDRPVAVCGDPKLRHGIILAKNEAAKAFGVKTAETVWQAVKKCPGLVLLPAHHEKYVYYSRLVNEIYLRYTDLVEPFGIDESWLDITGSMHLFGASGASVADGIRRTVREELGLTVSVGVSFNKVFAKLGSDYKKPDATTVIDRDNFRSLVWPLPAEDLLFVGKAAAKLLCGYGISTIGDLAAFNRDALVSLLGRQGAQLHDYATGGEHSPVAPAGIRPVPKSVGNGLTFPRDLIGPDEIRKGLEPLSDSVAMRLRRYGLNAQPSR